MFKQHTRIRKTKQNKKDESFFCLSVGRVDVRVFRNILHCSTYKFRNVHSATFPLINCKPIKRTEKIGCT